MAPESVLNIISNGYVLPFKDQPPRRVFKNHSNCVRYEQFIDDSIKDLVLCPKGSGFAEFVVDCLTLPNNSDLFLPGVQQRSAFGRGALTFPVLALRLSFQ